MVVLNDPIGGQGANSAFKAAAFYLKEINVRCVGNTGWHKQSFILGDKIYYPFL